MVYLVKVPFTNTECVKVMLNGKTLMISEFALCIFCSFMFEVVNLLPAKILVALKFIKTCWVDENVFSLLSEKYGDHNSVEFFCFAFLCFVLFC